MLNDLTKVSDVMGKPWMSSKDKALAPDIISVLKRFSWNLKNESEYIRQWVGRECFKYSKSRNIICKFTEINRNFIREEVVKRPVWFYHRDGWKQWQNDGLQIKSWAWCECLYWSEGFHTLSRRQWKTIKIFYMKE